MKNMSNERSHDDFDSHRQIEEVQNDFIPDEEDYLLDESSDETTLHDDRLCDD